MQEDAVSAIHFPCKKMQSQQPIPQPQPSPPEGTHNASQFELEQPSLPATDRGKDAWLMLASCCLIQLPVWGTATALDMVLDRTLTPSR
ncbi:unnamed protein product [Aspergillus oryzae]|nr:unnamed protein product [Aspergillus oryzae]GMF88833.1 unnamed protein product [Aspergillus oryzae]